MLTGKQKRYLRSLANSIKPIGQIGKDGINRNAYNSIDDFFNTHELIKISVLKTCDEKLEDIAKQICSNCSCELVQIIGKTIILYKKAKEPKILFND